MSAAFAARVGLRRGVSEFVQSLTRPDEFGFNVVFAGIVLTVLTFQRHDMIDGSPLPLATLALPGVVGGLIAFNGLGGGFVVAFEREDGTLLRAKALPNGIIAYFAGQVVRVPLSAMLSTAFLLIPGLFIVDGLAIGSLTGWLTFAWVLLLGLLAIVPIGMVMGALIGNPRVVGEASVLVSGVLIAISGIFYPISALPGWLHPVAQLFPFYWLGLGMRSALLPHSAVGVELSGSWQHWQTAAALGAWAVLGLILAPIVLGRMARRETGASMATGRLKAAQRLG